MLKGGFSLKGLDAEVQVLREEFWLRNTQSMPGNGWLKHVRPVLAGGAGSGCCARENVSETDRETIDRLCNGSDVLVFNFYATILSLLLSRYAQSPEIFLLGEEGDGGYFLFRSRVSGSQTFKEVFSENKEFLFDAIRYPVDQRSLRELLDQQVMADVSAILLTVGKSSPGSSCGWWQEKTDPGPVLRFGVVLEEKDAWLTVEAAAGSCEEGLLKLLAANFAQLIRTVPAGLYEKVGTLDWQSDREKALLASFNDTGRELDEEMTVADRIRAQARLSPEAPAVLCRDTILTYRQLDDLTDRIGMCLRAEYAIGAGDIVGVRVVRTEWLPILALAVFKIGAVYLPIDPDYPEDRIDYILSDSGCRLLVDEQIRTRLEESALRYQAGSLPGSPGFRDLAYILYTSGSTGRPKGAMIEHAGMINHLYSKVGLLGLDGNCHVVQNASAGFDISIWQMFSALLCGGRVSVYGRELVGDVAGLLAAVSRDKPTVLELVPSYLSAILDVFDDGAASEMLDPIEWMLVTGEELPPALVERWFDYFPGKKLVNAYGPTEASDDIAHFVMEDNKGYKVIPVGRVVQNLHIHIVDAGGQECPIGIGGEILVSGIGVGRGYVNDADKTRKSFGEDNFRKEKGVRLYRTGDRGRWLCDGNIEFLGRMDSQIKINGHRIEPGEIESVICAHPKVRLAVVLARNGGNHGKELIAFIETADGLMPSDLAASVGLVLPGHMLPSRYIPLNKFPLSENGKVDRHALGVIGEQQSATVVVSRAPMNETEAQLAGLWQSILGRKEIAVSDDLFAIGGHSLDMIRLMARIKKVFEVDLSLADLFARPVLADQAAFIRRQRKAVIRPIVPAPAQDSYPISSSQRRLWLLTQLEEGNVAYNMPEVYVFEGSLDVDAIDRSFATMILRHEILRTVFRDIHGEVRQVVCPPEELNFQVEYYDLRDEENAEERTRQLVSTAFLKPFDLYRGPLLRAGVIRLDERRCVFTYVMHHIISDGWSMAVLMRELLELYSAFAGGREILLPELTVQYKDYAVWQQAGLEEAGSLRQKEYWLRQMNGVLPVLQLPVDHKRPSAKTYRGGAVEGCIDPALKDAFYSLLNEEGATLFMGLLSAVSVLLHRYTGQTDLIVGSPIAGRDHPDLEDQIGFYVNTLALRTKLSSNDSFSDVLREVKEVCLGAFANQEYPFDTLIEDLGLTPDASRNPLFDVSLILQNAAGSRDKVSPDGAGLRILEYKGKKEIAARFDLLFDFVESESEVAIRLIYNSDIYTGVTAQRIVSHLLQLLAVVVGRKDQPVGQLSYLTEQENALLLSGFNDTRRAYPRDSNIVAEFVAQSGATPVRTALVYGENIYTYAELNDYSDRLAACLSDRYGIERGHRVGLLMGRPDLMIVAILSILKAGGAYVPVDPEWPGARKKFVLEDAGVRLLITSEHPDTSEFFAGPCFEIAGADLAQGGRPVSLPAGPGPSDLAYILYTSGSTGEPKGVMVEHRSVLRLVKSCDYAELDEEGCLLSTGAVSFDATTFEYWSMLLNGGQLVVCNRDVLWDPAMLASEMRRMQVNIMWFTAGWLHQLAEQNMEVFAGLRILLTGGDVVSPAHIRRIQAAYPKLQIINGYGPTENTCFSTVYRVPAGVETMYIGRPIPNSTVFIFDAGGMLCPVGVVGEIYVGGDGLARGYLNNTGLTDERFVANPLAAGERLYRTGDIGRWMADGNVEFLGRRDQQVKIRGYRVEIPEIESALLTLPDIRQAVVTVCKNKEGQNELVGYIVSGSRLDLGLVNSFLSKQLPVYMLLSRYVPMAELPLTANGKTDRGALPDAGEVAATDKLTFDPPSGDMEYRLAGIWEEVLGSGPVGKKDNFFELGGHSLKLMQVTSRIYKEFGADVKVRELYGAPVLEQQALLIAAKQVYVFRDIERAPDQSAYPLSPAQQRLWIVGRSPEGARAYNTVSAYLVEGWIDPILLTHSFRQLTDRHEILRTVFTTDADGLPVQVVRPLGGSDFDILYADLRDADDPEARAREGLRSDASIVVDFSAGPLFTVALRRLSENRWILSYVMHHIICDGWSMDILTKELLVVYDALAAKKENPLGPLRIQYRDYTLWQRQQTAAGYWRDDREYWLKQLEGDLPVMALPADRMRPVVKTYNGATVRKSLDVDLCHRLRVFSGQRNATLFMSLLALVDVLLYRYTGQEDLIVGSPMAGRDHIGLEDQIGFYANTVALRTRLSGGDPFTAVLDKVVRVCLDGYRHQHYPFDELVEALGVRRDPGRNPLFDVWVVLQTENSASEGDERHRSFRILPYTGGDDGLSRFDLLFSFVESRGRISLSLNFNTDIFDVSTIERMAGHLEGLLRTVLAYPDKPVNELDYLDEPERRLLVHGYNPEPVDLPADATFVSLFEAQACASPSAVAVSFGECQLSYEGLNGCANQLACWLADRHGVSPEDIVGIRLPRSEWLMVAIVGVLKAGGAYLPIEPNYPEERVKYMVTDSRCKVVLDEAEFGLFLASRDKWSSDNRTRKPEPSSLVYLIYTSGSTGQPKGVMISHRSLLDYCYGVIGKTNMGSCASFGLVSTIAADLGNTVIFPALLTGGRLHIFSETEVMDGQAVARAEIDCLKIVPSHWKALQYRDQLVAPAKCLVFGGEALTGDIIAMLREKFAVCEIYNHYGPSETTVGKLIKKVAPDSDELRVPLGKPFGSSRAYILDERQRIVPLGVVGEICLGGAGLSKGYLNNPELTAEKFIPDPYCNGALIYRTGDLGRRRPDGDIEFLGRGDNQVKIRGFRLEPAEIESVLSSYDEVRAAAVIVVDDGMGQHQLAAFMECGEGVDMEELKYRLAERLPAYMIPQHLVRIDGLPLTPNGKIDRKQLRLPENTTVQNDRQIELPGSDVERRLVVLWSGLLGIKEETLGVGDNFFELGGHSLTAIRLVARIHEELNVRIDLMNFFDEPNIRSLAAEIENLLWIRDASPQPSLANN